MNLLDDKFRLHSHHLRVRLSHLVGGFLVKATFIKNLQINPTPDWAIIIVLTTNNAVPKAFSYLFYIHSNFCFKDIFKKVADYN